MKAVQAAPAGPGPPLPTARGPRPLLLAVALLLLLLTRLLRPLVLAVLREDAAHALLQVYTHLRLPPQQQPRQAPRLLSLCRLRAEGRQDVR